MPIYSTTEYENCVETQHEDYEEDSEEETAECRYEYVDARGEPILSTLIRAPSMFYTRDPEEEEEEEAEVGDGDIQMLTSLGDGGRCPRDVFDRCKNWSDAIRSHRAGIIIAETKKRKLDAVEYKARKAKEVVEEEDARFMLKIPKFSAGYLAKMKIAAAKAIKDSQKADTKYYTWKKGASTASTSHQAWGHRRSGGGKGKSSSLQDLNSEKAQAERVAARKTRQLNNKLVAVEEMEKRKTLMVRLDIQKAAETDRVKSEGGCVEHVVAEPKELTEAEIHSRQVIRDFNDKQRDMVVPELVEHVPVVATRGARGEGEWKKATTTKVEKKKKVELALTKSLFGTRKNDTPRKTMNTRLCRSVSNRHKYKCTRPVCSFAHTLDEWVIPKCSHGINCRFIEMVGGKCLQSAEREYRDTVCDFAHGDEINNKREYCKRVGISI